MKTVLSWSSLLLLCAAPAAAQLISIRTVPISQEHQFEIYPSSTAPMGGMSIALADPLLDPFSNPATGARLTGGWRFFGAPQAYGVSSSAGGGRTLAIGGLSKSSAWYGGVWLALQEIDLTQRNVNILPDVLLACSSCTTRQTVDLGPAARSRGNSYAFGMAGRELGNGWSLGSAVSYANLNAIDGVDLLYNGSSRINQSGYSLDLRAGLLKEWEGDRSLETMVIHNRFDTTHDVYYIDGFWDPGLQQFSQRARLEENLDHTNTWGLHFAYEQPLSSPGWRAGAILTVNRMDHPKIPNYAIMNIPRDPGNSSAFNVGFGLSRVLANSTLGIDLIYEPIWSHTWADAAAPIQTVGGQTIPAGGMTIENNFRFSNAIARMGVQQGFELGNAGPFAAVQLGLAVHSIGYTMTQHDLTQLSSRQQTERWVEWKPTWGLSLRFPELEIRYQGSVLHGTGRPGVGNGRILPPTALDAAVGGNILAAPSGPLTLDEVRVTTHQVSITVPIH